MVYIYKCTFYIPDTNLEERRLLLLLLMDSFRLNMDHGEKAKLDALNRHRREADAHCQMQVESCKEIAREDIFYCILFNYTECSMDDLLETMIVHFEHEAWLMALPPRRPLITSTAGEKSIEAIVKDTIYTASLDSRHDKFCNGRRVGRRRAYLLNDVVGADRRENIKVNLTTSIDNDFESSVHFVRNVAEILLALPNDDEDTLLIKKFVILFFIGLDKTMQHKVLLGAEGRVRKKNEEVVEFLKVKCEQIVKSQFNVKNINDIVKLFVLQVSMVYTGTVPLSRVRSDILHGDGVIGTLSTDCITETLF